jgi:hypothetical protein
VLLICNIQIITVYMLLLAWGFCGAVFALICYFFKYDVLLVTNCCCAPLLSMHHKFGIRTVTSRVLVSLAISEQYMNTECFGAWEFCMTLLVSWRLALFILHVCSLKRTSFVLKYLSFFSIKIN